MTGTQKTDARKPGANLVSEQAGDAEQHPCTEQMNGPRPP